MTFIFLSPITIPLYEYIIVHLSIHLLENFLQFLVIMSIAINIYVQVFLVDKSFQWGKYQEVQLLDDMVKLGLVLQEATKISSKVAVTTRNEWKYLLFYILLSN